MDSIYFVRAGSGRIKIGRSADVLQRLAQMQTASDDELVLMASFAGIGKFERRIHRALAGDRHSGEWFNPTPAVLSLAASATPDALMGAIGADVHVAAAAGNPGVTDQDRADLARADSMALEARALRRRVLSRIRQRNWRNRKDQPTNGD